MLTAVCPCEGRHTAAWSKLRYSGGITGTHLQGTALTRPATVSVASERTDATDPLITRFLDAVWMERGLSSNTLAAYRDDLVALSRWLALRHTELSHTARPD